MATRLPRYFAAAASAASASAASAGTTSSTAAPTPATSGVGQQKARRGNGREPWLREGAALEAAGGCQNLVGGAAGNWRRRGDPGTEAGPPAAQVGSSKEAIQASLKEALSSVRLLRVAHADAAMAEEAGEGAPQQAEMSAQGEGDKPEYIQRADEQAERMKQQLQRPSQFADQFAEVSQLAQVHSFEGFRLDMQKVVTPTFFTTSNVIFGNPQFPGGHYQGALTLVGESDTMVRASMDAECNVSMDAHAPFGMPGLAGKLTVRQGKNELIQGTALYSGDTCSGQLTLGTGPVEISYNQALTPQLSVGGQGQFVAAQQAVGLLYGIRYNTPSWAVLGRLIGGTNVVTAQYVRRVVPGRVALGAEYQAQLGVGSQVMIGAEFQLKQSKMSASVDGNGKVDSCLELRCGIFPTLPVILTLSSSLDHVEDKHTFGLALTCGQ